jgi:acetolactate synthase small subunit
MSNEAKTVFKTKTSSNSNFTDFAAPFEIAEIDIEKTKIKVKVDDTELKQTKLMEKIKEQSKVLDTAFERFSKSHNKKNKEFIINNLKKANKQIEAMLATLETE